MKLSLLVLGACLILGINASNEDTQKLNENELELFDEESFVETYGLLGKIQCKLCIEAMKPIAKSVKKDSAKREIVNALDKACTIIPIKKIRQKCRNSIKKHGDEITDKIAGNLAANKICQFLELC